MVFGPLAAVGGISATFVSSFSGGGVFVRILFSIPFSKKWKPSNGLSCQGKQAPAVGKALRALEMGSDVIIANSINHRYQPGHVYRLAGPLCRVLRRRPIPQSLPMLANQVAGKKTNCPKFQNDSHRRQNESDR
jgi:hypothetical protein